MNVDLLDLKFVSLVLSKSNSLNVLLKNLKFGLSSVNKIAIAKYITDNNLKYPLFWGHRKFSSVISNVSKDELQHIVDISSGYNEILKFFELRIAGANLKTLKNIIEYYSIDTSKMENNRKNFKSKQLNAMRLRINSNITYDDIKNKTFSSVRKYIITNNLLEYKCQIPECGNIGYYCGKPIILELDHIDGNRKNNELSNLRFLCPNCHSQTETFSGKIKVKKENKFCKCGNKLSKRNISGKCKSCASKSLNRPKKFEITKEKLEDLITQYSLVKIGKILGVSDVAVKKRCLRLGIDIQNIRIKT